MNIHTHLNECPEAEAHELRLLVQRLRAMPEQTPSAALHDQTLARVTATQRFSFWRSPWLGAAAGLALLLSGIAATSFLRAPRSHDIQWLLAQQEKDGTWNPSRHGGAELFRPALTALSVLALNTSSPRSSSAIDSAIGALGRMQTQEGFFQSADAQSKAYNLAMATFALAASSTQRPQARPIVSRAVEAIKACQLPNGSWDYAPTPEGNIAITSWMVRALKGAEEQGIGDSRIAQRKGLSWLLRNTAHTDGAVSYKPTEQASDTLTALTAVSFITAGKSFPDVQTCARQMTDRLALQSKHESQRDCYRDYAKIVALELAGNHEQALRIRNEMKAMSQAPDAWRVAGGDLYTAAFTALCK